MAYKFYHRYTAEESQRYKHFSPKVLADQSNKTGTIKNEESAKPVTSESASSVIGGTSACECCDDDDPDRKGDINDAELFHDRGKVHLERGGSRYSYVPNVSPGFSTVCNSVESCKSPTTYETPLSPATTSSPLPPPQPTLSRSLSSPLSSSFSSSTFVAQFSFSPRFSIEPAFPATTKSAPCFFIPAPLSYSSPPSLSSFSSMTPSSSSLTSDDEHVLLSSLSASTYHTPNMLVEARSSKKRKSTRPRRSAMRNDPKFKGVMFRVGRNRMKSPSRQIIRSQLSIRSFNRLLAGRQSRRRWRRQSGGECSTVNGVQSTQTASSSDDDYDGRVTRRSGVMPGKKKRFTFAKPSATIYGGKRQKPSLTKDKTSNKMSSAVRRSSMRSSKRIRFLCPIAMSRFISSFKEGKRCRSCCTSRTPLWRDADDGTPLCNACGIRYKKYGIRCPSCWLIPRKDSKTFPICGRCGCLIP